MKKENKEWEKGHFSFKAGRGMIAIYILNYVVNKEISIKKGKIIVIFVDLKMAFNRIDSIKLGEMLRRTGMRKLLRKRIMETCKQTKNIIKVANKTSEEFWTKSGVKQRCSMTPTLFNIYLIDLETEMRKEQTGGGKGENVININKIR